MTSFHEGSPRFVFNSGQTLVRHQAFGKASRFVLLVPDQDDSEHSKVRYPRVNLAGTWGAGGADPARAECPIHRAGNQEFIRVRGGIIYMERPLPAGIGTTSSVSVSGSGG